MVLRITGIAKAGARGDEWSVHMFTGRGDLTYLSITGQLLLSLLLVVFGIWILSSTDSGIIHFDSRVPILHHHASLRCSLSTILGELCLHGVLDREGPGGRCVSGMRTKDQWIIRNCLTR